MGVEGGSGSAKWVNQGCGGSGGQKWGINLYSTPDKKNQSNSCGLEERTHIFLTVNLSGNFIIRKKVSNQRTDLPSFPIGGWRRVINAFPQNIKIWDFRFFLILVKVEYCLPSMCTPSTKAMDHVCFLYWATPQGLYISLHLICMFKACKNHWLACFLLISHRYIYFLILS